MTTTFGQLVIGPPGSGKTTYCEAMSRFLKAIGREVAIVNIDPANENMPYKADIDVSELITLEDAMKDTKLGPNGGLMYCMEYLETNIEWLLEKLKKVRKTKREISNFSRYTAFNHLLETIDIFDISSESLDDLYTNTGTIQHKDIYGRVIVHGMNGGAKPLLENSQFEEHYNVNCI